MVCASRVCQMLEIKRPLSPHLTAYKWTVASSLSIFHRATGVALSAGAVALVAWIVSAAVGAEAYAEVTGLLAGPLGLLLLAGFSISFFFHLGNGIRHLAWDAGYGFDQAVARKSGWFTLIVAIICTALYWVGVLS